MEKNTFLEMYNDAISQQAQGITIRTDIAEGHWQKGVEYLKEYCSLSDDDYSLSIKENYIGISKITDSNNKRTILIPYDRILSVELWG